MLNDEIKNYNLICGLSDTVTSRWPFISQTSAHNSIKPSRFRPWGLFAFMESSVGLALTLAHKAKSALVGSTGANA